MPSKDEWWTLFDLANKTYPDSATYSLWATGFKNWPQAFDAFGFSVVPAGIRKSKEDVDRGLGYYRNLDEIAFFQVREPSCKQYCHLVCLSDSCEGTFLTNNANVAGLALSVRCLKNGDDFKDVSSSSSSSSSGRSSGSSGYRYSSYSQPTQTYSYSSSSDGESTDGLNVTNQTTNVTNTTTNNTNVSAVQDQGFNLGQNALLIMLIIAAIIVTIAIIVVYFKM